MFRINTARREYDESNMKIGALMHTPVYKDTRKKTLFIIIPILAAVFNIFIIIFPKEIIGAAKDGLWLWANNVLPSLLPFAVGVNVLAGLGVISFIGVLLEPVMRPVFGVPGSGGFALITGMTSGYPMGAKTAAMLSAGGQLRPEEAQRLMAFCNNSGPLFILGALGANMLNDIRLGYFIMAVHYLSAIINGLIFKHYNEKRYNEKRYHGNRRKADRGRDKMARAAKDGGLFARAAKAMEEAGNKGGGIGRILGESVENAVESMLFVGGFIIFFCVLVRMFELSGLPGLLYRVLGGPLGVLGLSRGLFDGVLMSALEVTNGARIISAEPFSKVQIILLCGAVSFGGLSVHAQSVSFLGKTGVKPRLYILGKLTHGAIAALTGWVLYPFFAPDLASGGRLASRAAVPAFSVHDGRALGRFTFSALMFLSALIIMVVIPLAAGTIRGAVKGRRRRGFGTVRK